MCHADEQWTEALPFVLGIRTAYKEDLQASVAELVYGEPIRIPGELLTRTAELVDPAHLFTKLRQHMARLRPVPAARHASPSTFVHSNLERCTHVFLCQDKTLQALEPPYSGPYWVLSRREKTATSRAREACHCVNGQGQADLHPQRDRLREQLQPTSHAATALSKNYTLRSSHPFPCSLEHLSNHLRGEGDVGTSHSAKQTTPTV
jgi:hypothetical protein